MPGATAIPVPTATPAPTAPAYPALGTVLVAAREWLQGSGVDVVSNGGAGADGTRQCGELAARLYRARGWPLVNASGNGGAAYLPEGSPGLESHAPGTDYEPVPGDLVIEGPTTGNPFGHVAIVDSVLGTRVAAVEQNASRTGRHDYAIDEHGTLTGGYGPVTAILHAPGNHMRSTVLRLASTTKATAPAGWVTHAPIRHVFTVRNSGRATASIAALGLSITDATHARRHLVCARGLSLRPGQTRTCTVSITLGAPGTYRAWADWMDARGHWHAGALGAGRTFTLHERTAAPSPEPVPVDEAATSSAPADHELP